jgi:ankyrin repeat protein
MHFFSPVNKMPLLEVVVTPDTRATALATAVTFGRRIGKHVIVVRDGPGFYTSRALAAYMNEASWLLDEGADVNARQGDGGTILARAVFIGKSPKVVKWLIEKGADVSACNTGGFTPLMYPPLYHQEEILRMLLDKGADVNARTETGLTPLFFWASAKNSEAMKLLFDRGADINAKDIEGGTALIRANITDPAVIKLFLDRGADLSVRDRRGATALSQTIKSGRKEIAELLKAAGAKE